ncbi:MAG: DUF58 domain-containing protein [Bifidobacteriaceae bacterium]|jgi:uncharacterized protein (DUF58 family)|nr:DUF58 domain-containing protein [Bifidobacteriaceae bacterium]MCI1978835.1 DUF58 domain-containing protein [Bifidobacteriaceae bacterium]
MNTVIRTDPVRKKIESLGSRLTLPITRKALGALEGEHTSSQRGHGYDYMDLRAYQPDDEAQLIDWKASARAGKPIIVNKQREVTSTVWLLLDVGTEMTASAQGGERLLDVAANALRMFAMLSLKRSDDVSLVFGDSQSITRLPFTGGYTKFDKLLDDKLAGLKSAPRNVTSLLEYASRIQGKNSLVVIASDETAMSEEHANLIKVVSQNHPLVFIAASPLNPFSPGLPGVQDASDGRLMPAFMRTATTEGSVAARREFLAATFERELARSADTLLRGGSSEDILTTFTHLISTRLHGSRPRTASLLPRLQPGASGKAIS